MNKYLKNILFMTIAIVAIVFTSACGTSDVSKAYVGLWHEGNDINEGYRNRYLLKEDGTFIFGSDQMFEGDNTLFTAGTWEIKSKRLVLTVTKKIIRENSELKIMIMESSETVELEVSGIKNSGDGNSTKNFDIDSKTYWQFPDTTNFFELYYTLMGPGN